MNQNALRGCAKADVRWISLNLRKKVDKAIKIQHNKDNLNITAREMHEFPKHMIIS